MSNGDMPDEFESMDRMRGVYTAAFRVGAVELQGHMLDIEREELREMNITCLEIGFSGQMMQHDGSPLFDGDGNIVLVQSRVFMPAKLVEAFLNQVSTLHEQLSQGDVPDEGPSEG